MAFDTLLVANRGEIAVRIMRSAKAMGYRCVAVYTDVDAKAPHVRMADNAVCIGAGPVADSYLSIEKIIDAAKQSGAQAIHPGYGFLSENADFARACETAGLVFVGPSAEAIDVMGNKAAAKRRMIDAGVPCVPGYQGVDQSDDVLIAKAKEIVLPVMVKAAAGGGGRGMRLVAVETDLANAISSARSEAENAFGSGELILEKAIIEPRHVEVQVFADRHGHTVHLGERDCSVQRRHQKVLEEAPCPVMTAELRERMGAAAVEAARSIHYVGAGTVEFLLDASGEFYFLEMNTRLQVEHPVTELVTGRDLVELQLRVAQGEALGFTQEEVALDGHAIEARLYAEDPAQDFLPQSGPIYQWSPAQRQGVRIDAGIASGLEVSPFYDPMVAKVIAHGPSREVARQRLVNALNDSVLFGVKHNRDFLVDCLEHRNFAQGKATTAFIAAEFDDAALQRKQPSFIHAAVAAAIECELDYRAAMVEAVQVNQALRNWSSASPLVLRKHYQFEGNEFDLALEATGSYSYSAVCESESATVELLSVDKDSARLKVDGRFYTLRYLMTDEGLFLAFDGVDAHYKDLIRRAGVHLEAAGSGSVVAPMHGLLLEVFVKVGDPVVKGQRLAVLEAMKMQHEILAQIDGMVDQVFAEAGAQIAAESLIMQISDGA